MKKKSLLLSLGLAIGFLVVAVLPAWAENYVTQEQFERILTQLEDIAGSNTELKQINTTLEQQNKDILQQNQVLRHRIETLEKKVGTEDGLSDLEKQVGILNEEIKYLSEDMEVVGRRALGDVVQIGAELRTRADWFDFHERVPERGLTGRINHYRHNEENVQAIVSNRFRLNLRAEINKNVSIN